VIPASRFLIRQLVLPGWRQSSHSTRRPSQPTGGLTYRPGAWIGRQRSLSGTAIRKRAKANGWTQDLSGAVRSRVRESLVREEVRANLLAGVTPSQAAIVDAAAREVQAVSLPGHAITR
jgi:hypothetical protein